jgi:hypothetical protein
MPLNPPPQVLQNYPAEPNPVQALALEFRLHSMRSVLYAMGLAYYVKG